MECKVTFSGDSDHDKRDLLRLCNASEAFDVLSNIRSYCFKEKMDATKDMDDDEHCDEGISLDDYIEVMNEIMTMCNISGLHD